MATWVWKGQRTFGLVSIPIRLFAAARTERISLNQLHKVCHSRIRQPQFCPTCNRQIERNEIIKGFEYEKDQYVLFTEEELDKLDPPSARTMEILQFVKTDEVDPLYFDASYYTTPEDAGKKAYQLLLEAMEESEHAAIAKLYMHQREYIVVIRPRAHGLTLHTMFYADEIRTVSEYRHKSAPEPQEQEKKLALQLIESLSAPFDPRQFRDEYRTSLRALIEAKLKGQEDAAAPHPQLAQVVDLVEALKKSFAGKQPAPREVPAEMNAPMTAMREAVTARKRAGKRSAG